ncbi:MAG: GNAT family N-acetyltransferase [Solirubrobacteraceae bacterium]
MVTIRPIRPDDRERLQRSHQRLSPESRYRRFLAAKPDLTATDAGHLVDIDGRDHYALVATVAEGDDEAIVAVARFVRLPKEPRTAEFAIVVGDPYQHEGLGGELLGRLADAAVTRGVDRFHAITLADNLAIRRLITRVADTPPDWHRDGAVAEVDFVLPQRRDAGPPAPAIIAGCAGS